MKTKRTRYSYDSSSKSKHAEKSGRQKSAKHTKHAKALVMPRVSIVLTMTFLLILGIISTTFSAFIANSDVGSNASNSGGIIATVRNIAQNQGSNISITRPDKPELAPTGWAWNSGDTWSVPNNVTDDWTTGSTCMSSGSDRYFVYYLKYNDSGLDNHELRFRFKAGSKIIGPNDGHWYESLKNTNDGGQTPPANNNNAYWFVELDNNSNWQRVLVGANSNDNYFWGNLVNLNDLSAACTASTTNITKGGSVKLTGSCTGDFTSYYLNNGEGGKKATYIYEYQKSGTSTWYEIGRKSLTSSGVSTESTGVTFTPTSTGTYYVRVRVKDDNVLRNDNAINERIATSSTRTITVKEQTHTVSFNNNGHGGTAPATQTVNHGQTATKPADPTATGYTFGGWYTSSACTGSAFNFSTAITKDTQLYAKWTIKEYTVTFNKNGHGTNTTQTVQHGQKATKPADPTATGYSFVGWYTTSACTTAFDFNTQITSNTTIYAKWEKSFNVTANANPSAYGTATVTYDSTTKNHTLVATNKTGYHFTGWTLSSSLESDIIQGSTSTPTLVIKANSDVTATAHFEPDVYNIIYKDMNNAAFSGTHETGYPTSHTYGTATTLKTATKTGYTFGGWFTNSACSGPAVNSLSATGYTSDITLYAKWTINKYTVSFNMMSHGSQVASQTVDYNSKASTPSPQPSATGYTFGGWYKESSLTTSYDFNTPVTSNITLYAKWTANTYTVTVDTNYITGVKGITATPATVEYPGEVVLSAVLDTGYSVDRWTITGGTYTLVNGTSLTSKTPRIRPSANLTVSVTAKKTLDTQVYYKGASGMDYLYMWDDKSAAANNETNLLGDWPGTKATSTQSFGNAVAWNNAGLVQFTNGNSYYVGAIINNGLSNLADTNGTDKLIAFNNTLGWSNVYVYYKNASFWHDSEGRGMPNTAKCKQMKRYGNTNYYYEYIPDGNQYVAFCKDDQSDYDRFYQTSVSYRGDFNNSDTPTFTPNTTASSHSTNNTDDTYYYSNGSWGAKPSSQQTDDIDLTNVLYNGTTWKAVPAIWIDGEGNVTTRTELSELIEECRTTFTAGNAANKFTSSSWLDFVSAYNVAVTAMGEYGTGKNQTYIDNKKQGLQTAYDNLELYTYFTSDTKLDLKKIYCTSIPNIINYNTSVILDYGFKTPYTKTISMSSDGVNYEDEEIITGLESATHNYSLTYDTDTVPSGVTFIKVSVDGADGNRHSELVAKTLFGTKSRPGKNNIYLYSTTPPANLDCRIMACFSNGTFNYWTTMNPMGNSRYRTVQPTGFDKVTFYYMRTDKYIMDASNITTDFCYAKSTQNTITGDAVMFNVESISAPDATNNTIGTISGAFGSFK